jgi:tRNA threonylcarbamoyladenosine biosynthesis protein TsaE
MKKEKQKSSKRKALPIFEVKKVFLSESPQDTQRLGQKIGRKFSKGVIALFGDLGAGKTVFAKGIAEALGVQNVRQEVISPSFMIIREHPGRVPFYHVDLYRIGSEDELYHLNLEEYLYREGITLIEWADRALSLLPKERLEVYFEVLGPKQRKIELKEVGINLNIKKEPKK